MSAIERDVDLGLGGLDIDIVGLGALSCTIACVAIYLLWCHAEKARNGSGHSKVAAGMFRLAAARGDLHAVVCLSHAGGFGTDAELGGFTALHAVCVQGQEDAAAWLCIHSANVAAQKDDSWQDTALHHAAAKGHTAIVKLLLAFGADPAAKNCAGATPGDLAGRSGYHHITDLLSNIISGVEPCPGRNSYQQRVAQLDAAVDAYLHTLTAALCSSLKGQHSSRQTRRWRQLRQTKVELDSATEQLLPSLLRPQQLLCNHQQQQRSQLSGLCSVFSRWPLLHGRQRPVSKDCQVVADSAAFNHITQTIAADTDTSEQHKQSAAQHAIQVSTADASTIYINNKSSNSQLHKANDSTHSHSQILQHKYLLNQSCSEQAANTSASHQQTTQPRLHTDTADRPSSTQQKQPFDLHHNMSRGPSPLGLVSRNSMSNSDASAIAGNVHTVTGDQQQAEGSSNDFLAAEQPVQMQPSPALQNSAAGQPVVPQLASQLADDRPVRTTAGPLGEASEQQGHGRPPSKGGHSGGNMTESSSRLSPGRQPDVNIVQHPRKRTQSVSAPRAAVTPLHAPQYSQRLQPYAQGILGNPRGTTEDSSQHAAPQMPNEVLGTAILQQALGLQQPPCAAPVLQQDTSSGSSCQKSLQAGDDSSMIVLQVEQVVPDTVHIQQQQSKDHVEGATLHLDGHTGINTPASNCTAAEQHQSRVAAAAPAAAPSPVVLQPEDHMLQQQVSHGPSVLASTQQVDQQALAALQQLMSDRALRAYEGLGVQGGRLVPTARRARPLVATAVGLSFIYIMWRACRSCVGGWYYLFSIPVLIAEIANALMGVLFMTGVWNQLERPPRWLGDMLLPEDFPTVDVYIVCYSEPPQVVKATVIAALNLNYPGSRLSVHVLDDGNSPALKDMVARLQFQARYMQRDAELLYLARQKVKGVPHHAKAGNINNALLKESPGHGDYILVLDCDMIAHPDFLMRTLGHFYRWMPTGCGQEGTKDCLDDCGLPVGLLNDKYETDAVAAAAAPKGSWVLKEKAAFIQTPQDFWNVSAEDPLVHFARFFYGPMLQGRDGIGACPCCGTGVVFRRDILVSIGGQAHGSITEDYNTAMTLMSAGFATLFLNERLSFGQAPDDLAGVFKQRLRWAMGALQILFRDNPLKRPGLTMVQSLLFWESAAQHFLAMSTLMFGFLPIVYIAIEVSPVSAYHLWEFCIVFCSFYLMNRLTMWQLHKGCEGGSQEIWRGSQMGVWITPNHCKAIWQVVKAEVPLLRWFTKKEIAFKVTKKKATAADASAVAAHRWDTFTDTLLHNGPFLVFYALTLGAFVLLAIRAAMGYYTLWRGTLAAAAGGWLLMMCMCMWPPVSTLLPREETDQGWKVRWDLFLPVPQPLIKAASTAAALLGHSHSHNDRTSANELNSNEAGAQPCLHQSKPQQMGYPLHSSGPGAQHAAGAEATQAGLHKLASPVSGKAAGQHGSSLLEPATDYGSISSGRLRRASSLLLSPLGRATQPLAHADARCDDACNIQNGQQLLPQHSVLPLTATPGHSQLARAASTAMVDATSASDPAAPNGVSYGRVSLPVHSQLARTSSALLTGLVLPERPVFAGLPVATGNGRHSSSGFRPTRTNSYGLDCSSIPGGNQTQDPEGRTLRLDMALHKTSSALDANAHPGPTTGGAAAAGPGALQLNNNQSSDSCNLPMPPLAVPPWQNLQGQGVTAAIMRHATQQSTGEYCSLPMPPLPLVTWQDLQGQSSTASPAVPQILAEAAQPGARGHNHGSGRPMALGQQQPLRQQLSRIAAASARSVSEEPWLPVPPPGGPAGTQDFHARSPGTSAAGDAPMPQLALARRDSAGPLLVIGSNGEIGAAPLTAAVLWATQGGSRSRRVSPSELTGEAVDCTGSSSMGHIQPTLLELPTAGSGPAHVPAAGLGLQRLVSEGSVIIGALGRQGSLPADVSSSGSWTPSGRGIMPDPATTAATAGRMSVMTKPPCQSSAEVAGDGIASACDTSVGFQQLGSAVSAGKQATLLVVPTEPATIFEASIAARPNFDDRELPPSNYWYMAINGFILLILVCGAVIELVTGKVLH